MSRLFVLTFRGRERFREVTHDHDPHESPWIMLVPLVVLAVCSTLAGVLDLPWVHHDSIAGFLAGAISITPVIAHADDSLQWILAAVDVAAAIIGIAVAFTLWRSTSPWPPYELSFFERVWRWDDLYDFALGRPVERLAQFGSDVVEPRVIDGAVTGTAVAVRRSAEGVSKMQSGFLRHYALAIATGLAVLVVYLLSRSW
jgi:NADH-quinone oxidoreductase subunit L